VITVIVSLVVADSIAVILIGLLVAGILRYLGGIQQRLEALAPRISGLSSGDTMPDFHLKTLDGVEARRDDVVGGGVRTVLLVLNDQCDACEVVARQCVELAERDGGLAGLGWRLVLSWVGSPDTFTAKLGGISFHEPALTVLMDPDGQIAKGLLVSSFPVGLALDNTGRLLSQSGNPGPTWLYTTTGASAPAQPIVLDDRRWTSTLRTRG